MGASAVSKVFSWRRLILVNLVILASANGSANGGWVIERDDRGESPLTKERKSVAMSPEQRIQQAYAQAYRQALAEERQKIQQQWPSNPEVSGQTRWVVYTEDYGIKKVVDFEFNRLEISIASQYKGGRLDFARMATQVRSEVEALLATTIEQALASDPITQALDATHKQLTPSAPSAARAQALVLSLLFDSNTPSEQEIKDQAAKLMSSASIRYGAMTASLASVPVSTSRKLTYVIPLPDHRIRRKVVEYNKLVAENSARFNLSQDVILAIIHTESHFNPLARSHVPAFGLMQIVPATAGRDAARKLYRKPRLFSAQYLYNPRQNIEIGSAYLNMLYYDYLKEIKNPDSRLYYTIAAYNAGASSVARAFVNKASFKDAIAVINTMTSEQVLERLVTRSPSEETRQYVRHVLERRALYAAR